MISSLEPGTSCTWVGSASSCAPSTGCRAPSHPSVSSSRPGLEDRVRNSGASTRPARPTIIVWMAVPACCSCVRGSVGEPRSWPARRADRGGGCGLHDRRLQRWQRGHRRRQEPERRRLRLSCRRRGGRPGGGAGLEGVRGSHVLAVGRPRQLRHRVQALREPRGVRPHARGRVLAQTDRPVSTRHQRRQACGSSSPAPPGSPAAPR